MIRVESLFAYLKIYKGNLKDIFTLMKLYEYEL